MTAEQFTYWLQGYLEISGATELDIRQTQMVRDHLQLVFNKQTPNRLSSAIPIPDKTYCFSLSGATNKTDGFQGLVSYC